MESCYSTFAGWGKDAQLRTRLEKRKEARGEQWRSEWDVCFCDCEQATDPADVRRAYTEFMSYFAESLGIGVTLHAPHTARTPRVDS